MSELQRENDCIVRTEVRSRMCEISIETWEPGRTWDRAASIPGATWGPCLQTPRGSWKIEGTVEIFL